MMKDTRRSRTWTLIGTCALALAAGVVSKRMLARRSAAVGTITMETGLRDAVASPMAPATAGLAGKPVPTAWFKTSEQRSVEMNSALLSSRRRRARARRIAVQ
jgi:hypothetical protein